VLAVRVAGATDTVRLLRGRRSKMLTIVTATEVIVDGDAPSIPVGVDGEAVSMPTPVRCAIRPGALRVRVPRNRPGTVALRPSTDWDRLRRLAMPAR
jgi:diacylglycerol kinase family enzyme